MVLANFREAAAFLVYKLNFTHDAKNREIECGANTVTPDSRPCGAKSVFEQKFLIEKNAKNQAYHFIIKCGLSREFRDFCVNYRSADPFEECIKLLAEL